MHDVESVVRNAVLHLCPTVEADVFVLLILLSVERFEAKPESHRILLRRMAVFEGLSLAHVKPGSYIFIGFPIKIGIDAAPVRAVLVKE